jgi:hypothetical protein
MLKRNMVVGVVIVLAGLIAGLGYMSFVAAQKRSQQRQVQEAVRDTTDKLRQVLSAKIAPDMVAALDANLQAAKAPRDPRLASAAEGYIVGAREVARRRTEIERLTRQATTSRQALASHMARASSRNDAWMRDALALKKRVEDDHFHLGLALKALDEILYSMPDAEKALAAHVGRDILIETSLRDSARKQAQDELRRAADDLERARRIQLR